MLCCAVLQCHNVLSCMWAVLWWISAPSLLFVLLVHMCGDSLLDVRVRSAQTAQMGDVVVNEGEWIQLHNELCDIIEDAGKVNSFMVKHVNTKWEVRSACVGFI